MKKLTNVLQNKIENNENTKTESKQEQLDNAISKIAEIKPEYDSLDKAYTENKNAVKALCKDLNIDAYEKFGIKVNLIHVDKSYLEEGTMLEFLKKNGYERFIKTKEYFDEAEIAMAVANNEIKAEDLQPFMVNKEEVRLSIKISN